MHGPHPAGLRIASPDRTRPFRPTATEGRAGRAWRLARATLLLALLTGGAAAAGAPGDRARLLHKFAESALGDSSIENRERARRDIEEAIRLDPGNPEHFYLLGRLDLQGELDSEARAAFAQAVARAPGFVDARMALAFAWKRQWLRTLDSLSIASAYAEFDTVSRLRPHGSAAWLQLVPLGYEGGDVQRAATAAANALAGRPHYAESAIAAAYLAYRTGRITESDSLFRAAIPLLAEGLRHWFDAPGLGARDASAAWQGLDPDPTTPENEMQLEYWSRVAHALLLFYDPDRPGYDARAETYVRYGPPARAVVSPFEIPGYFKAPTGPAFATPIIAWYYPDLGMRVVLQDRALHGRYQTRSLAEFDPLSVPDPKILASRHDLASFDGGYLVMPKLPPPTVRLETRSAIARFEGAGGPRIVAQVEAPGRPADPLSSRWVVREAGTGRVVARSTEPMAPSGCDPASVREAQFTADLPPGEYEVAVSIRDPLRWRALDESRVTVGAGSAALSASDLVPVCGEPGLGRTSASLRFDIDTESRRQGSRPLVAYVEIYHLARGTDGLARFRYEYEVRQAAANGGVTGPALLSLSRDDVQVETLRRQFFSVPLSALRPGRYALVVRITDRVANGVVERSIAFVRE